MDRASIYYADKNENTYDFDETLPPLPLPDLRDTMQRYYESLQPFASPQELANTRTIITDFEKGIGAQLHAKLKERAKNSKNWLGEWWDKYGYHMLRLPLNPYIVMAMPLQFEVFGLTQTPEFLLKNLARIAYHTLEFWDLLHKAKIKPLSSNGGKINYSSALYKRFFSTSRAPGVEYDHLEKYFRAVPDGNTPTHALLSGKGRFFIFECLHADGSLITPQELLIVLQRVRSIIDYEPIGDCVSVLTHDDRTSWAHNYQHLKEISAANKDTLKLMESSNIVLVLDENEPHDFEEVAQNVVYGDYHSKWGDRSSTIVAYKNGKFACVGEHSAYDGTVSVSYVLFTQLSLQECGEPDWSQAEQINTFTAIKELHFELDDKLKQEIQRVTEDCNSRGHDVIVAHVEFNDYCKDFIKTCKLHPDSFVQVIMQLAYAKMHNEIAATYETALMRHFYNGRTETLRSCTNEVYNFIKISTNSQSSKQEILNAFRTAVEHHNHMMNEARKGHGIDRHLFGLWCIAFENNIDIPAFYDDPLYSKSGGGGNYVLSSSTLGYTVNVGFVAPMTLDGYGVFYSITPETLFIETTAYRASIKTSAHKYNEIFKNTLRDIKTLLDDTQKANL